MKIGKKIGSFLQLISLIGFLWLLFFSISFFLKHDVTPAHFDFPKSAQLSLTIDGKTISKDAFYSLFIEDKDIEIANELKDLRQKVKQYDTQQSLLVGIDIFNEIKIFTDEYKGKPLAGYIFKLNNTRLWDKNNARLFNSENASIRSSNTGLIVRSNTLSKAELKKYLNSRKFDKAPTNKDSERKNALLTYKYAHNKTKTTGIFQIDKNKLKLNGDFNSNDVIAAKKINYYLKPTNFHITSALFPNEWNRQIKQFAQDYSLDFPAIEGISLNYSSMEISSTQDGVIPIPKLELIIQFQSEFSIIPFLANLKEYSPVAFTYSDSYIEISGNTYYFNQLDTKTIYIGISKKPQIISKSYPTLFTISGSLKPLTKINGNEFLVAMVKMTNPYKQLDKIAHSIETIELDLMKSTKNKNSFNGELSFKKNKNGMSELLKLILQLQK